jgi:hypothetical protein
MDDVPDICLAGKDSVILMWEGHPELEISTMTGMDDFFVGVRADVGMQIISREPAIT